MFPDKRQKLLKSEQNRRWPDKIASKSEPALQPAGKSLADQRFIPFVKIMFRMGDTQSISKLNQNRVRVRVRCVYSRCHIPIRQIYMGRCKEYLASSRSEKSITSRVAAYDPATDSVQQTRIFLCRISSRPLPTPSNHQTGLRPNTPCSWCRNGTSFKLMHR